MSLWHNVTTDFDNRTFDTGRFIVIVVAGLVVGVITFMCVMAGFSFAYPDHKFDFGSFGAGVGWVLGGFATLLGAFAAYVLTDRKAASMQVPVQNLPLPAPSAEPPLPGSN